MFATPARPGHNGVTGPCLGLHSIQARVLPPGRSNVTHGRRGVAPLAATRRHGRHCVAMLVDNLNSTISVSHCNVGTRKFGSDPVPFGAGSGGELGRIGPNFGASSGRNSAHSGLGSVISFGGFGPQCPSRIGPPATPLLAQARISFPSCQCFIGSEAERAAAARLSSPPPGGPGVPDRPDSARPHPCPVSRQLGIETR
jgi:hypothetical protein